MMRVIIKLCILLITTGINSTGWANTGAGY